jgi:hypothetical protein
MKYANDISALFMLHEAVLTQSSKVTDLDRCKNCAEGALSTVGRIVIEMSYSFNRNIPGLDIGAIPPACSHISRVIRQYTVIIDYKGDDVWDQDLANLKKTLECFHQRWPVAGR